MSVPHTLPIWSEPQPFVVGLPEKPKPGIDRTGRDHEGTSIERVRERRHQNLHMLGRFVGCREFLLSPCIPVVSSTTSNCIRHHPIRPKLQSITHSAFHTPLATVNMHVSASLQPLALAKEYMRRKPRP